MSTIANVQFPNQLVTLFSDYGPAVGNQVLNGSELSKQRWHFINKGGSQFTLVNAATKTYLGGGLTGSAQEYIWNLVPQSSPASGYHFQTTDGSSTWVLSSGANNASIVLGPASLQDKDAEWTYSPVD